LLRVGDFQSHLVLELLPPHLRLPNFELFPDRVCLSHAIPQWQIQLHADAVRGVVALKNLAERCAVTAAGDVRQGNRGDRIKIARQAAVLQGPDEVQLRFDGIERTFEADLRRANRTIHIGAIKARPGHPEGAYSRLQR
jgi:hypothetical protein